MKTAVAAFVKTPGLSPVKTRLAADIGDDKAEEVYLDLVEKTRLALTNTFNITPYWAVGEKEGVNSPLWQDFQRLYTGEGDLAVRMSRIYNCLLVKYQAAIIIGSDCPDISPFHLKKAIELIKEGKFVFGPTYDGGFYLFGGAQHVPVDIWKKVEYSRDDTLANLLPLIEKLGEVVMLDKLHDVDTVDDLAGH